MFGRETEMDLGASSGRADQAATIAPDTGLGPRGPYEPGRFALSLFTLAVLVAGALMFVRLENDALDDPVKQAERGEIDARSTAALTTPANFEKALNTIDGELDPGGFIDTLRVAPTRIDATVVQPSGQRENISVNTAFDANSTDFGTGEGEGLQPQDVDTAAPAKIIRVSERKYGLKPENFDYMAINRSRSEGSPTTWSAFWKLPLKDNDITATAQGTDVRLLGTPDAKARAEMNAGERASQRAAARAACIGKADTADEIQECIDG
ncbi:MAG: hypothetical protein JHC95_00730 [Solirubrobacteraceae bacterium]|nr:hypothetical protein [Solirubrobacteraceae bacterium]